MVDVLDRLYLGYIRGLLRGYIPCIDPKRPILSAPHLNTYFKEEGMMGSNGSNMG